LQPLHAQLERALDEVRDTIRRLKCSRAENPFKLRISATGHCSVRTQIKIEQEEPEFAVNFGDDSPL
jgi:hypothetical protein